MYILRKNLALSLEISPEMHSLLCDLLLQPAMSANGSKVPHEAHMWFPSSQILALDHEPNWEEATQVAIGVFAQAAHPY